MVSLPQYAQVSRCCKRNLLFAFTLIHYGTLYVRLYYFGKLPISNYNINVLNNFLAYADIVY